MTMKAYLDKHELVSGALVTSYTNAGPPIIQMDKTIFHPQGGGQKADRGTIGGVEVIHVLKAEMGGVFHILAHEPGFVAGDLVQMAVDKKWRTTNAVFHTAGHLIANVFPELWPGSVAKYGHQWPGEARVEFEGGDTLSGNKQFIMDCLTEQLAENIRNDLPVNIVGDPFVDRLIQIGDFDPTPCGGTHVAGLGEIAEIRIKNMKVRKGILRISYDATLNFK